MSHTHKGRKWEDRQSWYLLALLTPWTYWMPLVYTGLRTMEFEWVMWGLFYGLPVFIHLEVNPAEYGAGGLFKYWQIAALIAAVIHTFRTRGEYLVRLANANNSREAITEAARPHGDLNERVEEAGTMEDGAPVEEAEPLQAAEPAVAPPPRRLFDVNRIGEQELAMLPGMGQDRARQVIAMRDLIGEFYSFDHFADRMSLETDLRERLRPMFIQPMPVVPPNPQLIEAPDGSRHLEINLASAEEIATLPGLDVEIARRAVALRGTGGPYKSVEDFRYRLGLPVDVLVQFSSMVSTLETPAKRSGSVTPSARIVEAGGPNISDPAAAAKPRAARIVDL